MRTSLKRYAPLQPRLALVPVDVRRALEVRSGGVCEIAREGCLGRAWDVHHRVLRGSGGRHGSARQVSDRLSNLVHTCRSCHEWVHGHPAAAGESGWLLGGREVAPLVALLYRGEPAYLDDLGGVHAFAVVGA